MPTDPKRAQAVFLEAVERPPGERDGILDRNCGGNGELRQRVEVLLRAHDQPGSFLETPAIGEWDGLEIRPGSNGNSEPFAERPGTVIGPYKLLQELGEGGMGTVFLAEQRQPVQRKVALKIVKPGMDTRQVIARFEAERQALALMDHPNIAKVLDAGATESGRPYFVMELVKGLSITSFCDQERLTLRERLELFVPICHAVQHAHQKGVIHRDLKPSNVIIGLYDDKPVPKVIDFGVVKATSQNLTERTMFTQVGQIVGTLEYMAPEQAKVNNLDVDTRADVYSLGAILYELLTGSPPFTSQQLRNATFDEMMRMIRVTEPPRPSTRVNSIVSEPRVSASGESPLPNGRGSERPKLAKLMRGELDWIVMKCLEKDRSRRYETASALAADLQAYLHDEPVRACPPSAWYQFRKFIRRHKNSAAAVMAAFLGLLMASLALGYGLFQVKAEQKKTVDELRTTIDAKNNLNMVLRFSRGFYAEEVHRSRRAEGMLGLGLDYLRNLPSSFKDREMLRLPPHARQCSSVAWSPDSRLLATGQGYFDGTVKIWDADTGKELQTFQYPRGTGVVRFSPDGRRLACGANQCIAVRDLASGHTVFTGREQEARITSLAKVVAGEFNAAFSPDGQRLAVAGLSGTVRVWDTLTAVSKRMDPDLLLDADTKSSRVDPENSAHSTRKKRSRTYLVAEEVLRREGHFAVAWSPDGRHIARGVQLPGKELAMVVKVYDVNSGRETDLHQTYSVINCLAFSPDGRCLASADSIAGVMVSDLTTGNLVTSLGPVSFPHEWVPFSRMNVFPSSPMIMQAFPGNVPDPYWEMLLLNCVVYSPDGCYLAAAGLDGNVRIWDARFERLGDPVAHIDGRMGPIFGLAFSPKSDRLAAAGGFQDHGIVKIWDKKVWKKTQSETRSPKSESNPHLQ